MLKLSLNELRKNKLFFGYFTVGLAILLSVICILANYSGQVFEGFFTQFRHGQVLPLEMSELPEDMDLPIFAEKSGITYDVTISHGEKSVFLPSYRGGICVVSINKEFIYKEFALLSSFGVVNFDTECIFLKQNIAEELGCKQGDKITISGTEYTVKIISPFLIDTYNFIIYDPLLRAENYTVIVSNKDELLTLSEQLNSENFTDTEGILALCEGYRAMKTALNIVMVILVAVLAAFIFVFIKMYFSRRADFLSILCNCGIRKSWLFAVIGTDFAVLSFISSGLGFGLAILLDFLVDKWARELIKMRVDEANYLAYFAVGFAVCLIIAAVSLIINISKSSEKEVRNR